MRSWLGRCALAVWLGTAACGTPPALSVAPYVAPALPVPPLCPNGSWAWSADGSALLASCERGVEIRDGKTGMVRAQRASTEKSWGIINADASLVALPLPGRVELRRGQDLSLQSLLLLDATAATTPELAFSADGKRLAAWLPPRLLVEVSITDARVLWRLDDAVDPVSMPTQLRYVGDTIHVSMSRGPSVAFAHGAPVYPRWLRQDSSLSVNRSSSQLLLFTDNSNTTLWDVASDSPVSRSPREYGARQRWLGDYLATELRNLGLRLTRADTPSVPLVVPGAPLFDSQISEDGGHLRTVASGEIVDWTLPRLAPRRLAWAAPPQIELLEHGFLLETRPSGLILRSSSDGRVVTQLAGARPPARGRLATVRGDLVLFEDDADRKPIARISSNGTERTLQGVKSIAFDAQARRAAFVEGKTIRVVDTSTFATLLSLPDPPDRDQLAFRSAQNELVILHRLQKLSFVDLQTGQTRREVPFPTRYGSLQVSLNGEYVAHVGPGLLKVWSESGVQDWADPDQRGASFSADSRALLVLSGEKLVTHDLATGRITREEALPTNASAAFVGDHILLSGYGAQAIRALAPSLWLWRPLRAPSLAGIRLLGFESGALLAFDRDGSFLRWPLAALSVSSALRVPAGSDAQLSPDSSILAIRGGANTLFDLHAEKDLGERPVDAWSLDGSASLSFDSVVRTDGSGNTLVRHAVAFAGDAGSVFAVPEDDLVLHDLRAPTTQARLVARGARIVAQSTDQLTVAISTDRGRSLSLLRAPNWQPLGKPMPINGARATALSSTGDYLATLNESNELEVRFVTPSGGKPASLRLTLPPAPAVSRMLFTPDARFLVLEGTPVRFLRLADGAILNAYIARSDNIERLSAPLLFVDAHGGMEGDVALARQLYCDSLPVTLTPHIETPPCLLPRVSHGLVARFFTGN